MVYVAPSPDRPRPYSLFTNDPSELRQIMDAERGIRHLVVKNHMHRDTNWKLQRMRAEGSEFHCYNSILVNGEYGQTPVSCVQRLTRVLCDQAKEGISVVRMNTTSSMGSISTLSDVCNHKTYRRSSALRARRTLRYGFIHIQDQE